MLRFEDLTYSVDDLEKDAIHYLQEQVYEPSYVNKVKEFIYSDIFDFKQFYDDKEYIYLNLFYDEYQDGYVDDAGRKIPLIDNEKIKEYLKTTISLFDVSDDDIEKYCQTLENEFKKNAFCSHGEPYFVDLDAVVYTAFIGYSRNPIFSIYSIAREWCMAMHLKYLHPQLFRRFGVKYQEIIYNYTGDEKLKRVLDYRDKYKMTLNSIGLLRVLHSSVFAYAYLYLKSILTKEIITIEEFILDSSSSKISLLMQGESIANFDFPVIQYVLDYFKEGNYKEFFYPDGKINWALLYKFTFDAIKEVGFGGIHLLGFDSIEAKTMQSYWNKSSNMQSMLKILRRMALDNNNSVFRKLIKGCEYRLGRPDIMKERMEMFIENTRKIMAARSYELTKPRTMSQELISAFPSVFLVYFQWHHNFRNVYPKVPKNKIYEENVRQTNLANDFNLKNKLKDQIYANDKIKNEMIDKNVKENIQREKVRAILMNKEKTMLDISIDKNKEQKEALLIAEKMQRQNTI